MTIDELLVAEAPPIIAILRGIRPDEAIAIAGTLIKSGIRLIEVPLNSPEPFISIAAMQEEFGEQAIFGAGTVLDTTSVDRLSATGAGLMVAPNVNPPVIARTIACGLAPMPGFVTPSEAFAAIAAGARRIKLFPAASLGPDYLKAIGDVLPGDVRVWAVGGTNAANVGQWLAAGAEGIGVGGALYRPGDGATAVGERAEALVTAWRETAFPTSRNR